MSLSERTQYEYQRVLSLGLTDTQAVAPMVASWSYGRRIVMKAALQWAADKALLAQDKATELRAQIDTSDKRPVRKILAPSEDDTVLFENAAKMLLEPHRSMILLLLYVGLRGSELLNLPRASVERAANDGMLLVMRKGDKQMMLPLGKGYSALFKAFLAHAEWPTLGDLLLPGRAHVTRLHKLEEIVHAVAEKAGIKAHPHLLRHICANRMHAKGATLLEVQEWLGHERIETTMKYLNADLKHAATFLPTV